MRFFELHRDIDETGISGTGVVAEGVEFTNGKVVVGWMGKQRVPSVGVFDSIAHVERISGHGGKTRIVFSTGFERVNVMGNALTRIENVITGNGVDKEGIITEILRETQEALVGLYHQ